MNGQPQVLNSVSPNKFRSKQTLSMIREYTEKGEVRTVQANMPIGNGWGDGTGSVYWINRGWTPEDEYLAKKHKAEVESEREIESKKKDKK